MSVATMANLAYARRRDVQPTDQGLPNLRDIARSTGTLDEAATPASNGLAAFAAYIPTEVLTVYVAISALFGFTVPAGATGASTTTPAASPAASPAAASPPPEAAAATAAAGDAGPVFSMVPWWVYIGTVILTPIVVWLVYAGKARKAGKPLPVSLGAWPKWEMIAATVACTIWAGAVPGSPLTSLEFYSAPVIGVAVLVVPALLGLIAPLASDPLEA